MDAADRAPDGAVIAIVYTQPHCSACNQVMRYLDDRGVVVVARDVVADASALAELEVEGYLTTPVTRIGERWIAGFKRGELDAALRCYAARQ